MKSVSEVLRSPGFKREVSMLLFFFAAIQGLISTIIFIGRTTDPEIIGIGIGGYILAIVYAVFAFMIKRGSTKALIAIAVLFGLDTLLLFVIPLEGAGKMLFFRALLVFFLIRYIRKQRVTSEPIREQGTDSGTG